jgi:hypothetical protein
MLKFRFILFEVLFPAFWRYFLIKTPTSSTIKTRTILILKWILWSRLNRPQLFYFLCSPALITETESCTIRVKSSSDRCETSWSFAQNNALNIFFLLPAQPVIICQKDALVDYDLGPTRSHGATGMYSSTGSGSVRALWLDKRGLWNDPTMDN